MEPDQRWPMFDITQPYLEDTAEWMSRDPHCPGNVIMYFQTAGNLLRLAWFDYKVKGAALFLSVAGLEGVLRLHFRIEDKRASLSTLLERAFADGLISDETFSKPDPIPKEMLKLTGKEKGTEGYAAKLMFLVRELRNDYFRGKYFLSPVCLCLAIQMREAADAVFAAKQREASELRH